MDREELILDMVKNLIDLGEDSYKLVKLCLLSKTADDVKMKKFIQKVFAYTDARRPLLLCTKYPQHVQTVTHTF